MSRVRPHFKVHTSLKSHRKTSDLASNDHLFATYVRLGMLFIERWGAKTGDKLLLSDKDLAQVTNRKRRDISEKTLRDLAEVSPISLRLLGEVWEITFPNFAIKQGFAPKNATPLILKQKQILKKKDKEKNSPPSGGSPRPSKALCPSDPEVEDLDELMARPKIAKAGVTREFALEKWSDLHEWSRDNNQRKVSWVATVANAILRDHKTPETSAIEGAREILAKRGVHLD